MTAAPPPWDLYASHPHFVLGFHGCDESVGEALLCGGKKHLKPSANKYDWLGSGVYFWEDSPQRAKEFAEERAAGGNNSKGDIQTPFVIGAIINLKRCLSLTDRKALEELSGAHHLFEGLLTKTGGVLPTNGASLRARKLDCAVFETLHQYRKDESLPSYDTVRGLFFEGEPLYPDAGFRSKNHIQICVRDKGCILGYFRPIPD